RQDLEPFAVEWGADPEPVPPRGRGREEPRQALAEAETLGRAPQRLVQLRAVGVDPDISVTARDPDAVALADVGLARRARGPDATLAAESGHRLRDDEAGGGEVSPQLEGPVAGDADAVEDRSVQVPQVAQPTAGHVWKLPLTASSEGAATLDRPREAARGIAH